MGEAAKLFYLDEYIEKKTVRTAETKTVKSSLSQKEKFEKLCFEIEESFKKDWNEQNGKNNEASDKLLDTQKKAIMGYSNEVNFFKGKIQEYLKAHNLTNEWFPKWYDDLVSAVFHEVWGLSVITEWRGERYKESSSAKIIGERVYFMDNGQQRLQEQRISIERLNQLKRALLLGTPEIRLGNQHYAEVYMLDGTRITIFDEGLAKETVIIFRKYVVKLHTFEEQARRGTIPYEGIPLFLAMIEIGYNICFMGPVRSAKTTFLETWQSYEDPHLEGISVETDPEVPLHEIMPTAPIIQIVADGDKLKSITKNLMRGDGDYLLMMEARDPVALKIAIEVTSKGTKRVKSTYHTSDPVDFPYDAASNIISEFGGDLYTTIVKVAKSYHYYFEFTSLKDKSKKRLKAIYEVRYNNTTGEITMHQICKYNPLSDSWTFKYDIGEDKEEIANFESVDGLERFKRELQRLEKLYPIQGEHIKKPIYSRVRS